MLEVACDLRRAPAKFENPGKWRAFWFTTHLDTSTPFASVTFNTNDLQKKRTSYQLYLHDKSNINVGNAMNYLAFIVQIIQNVHVCVGSKNRVKPRDAIGGKEAEPALIVESWMNIQRSLSLPFSFQFSKI